MRMSQNASRAWSVSRPSTRNSYSLVLTASLLVRRSGGPGPGSGLRGDLVVVPLGARPRRGPLQLQFDLDLVPVDLDLGLEADLVGDLEFHRAVRQPERDGPGSTQRLPQVGDELGHFRTGEGGLALYLDVGHDVLRSACVGDGTVVRGRAGWDGVRATVTADRGP